MKNFDLSEVTLQLLEMRKILANGWCKGRYSDGHRSCLVGAAYKVLGIPPPSPPSYGTLSIEECLIWERSALRRCLIKSIPPSSKRKSLVNFNDNSTKPDVLGLVDRAIELSVQ